MSEKKEEPTKEELLLDELYNPTKAKDMVNNTNQQDKKRKLLKNGVITKARCCRTCKHADVRDKNIIRCTVLDMMMASWEHCSQYTNFPEKKKYE